MATGGAAGSANCGDLVTAGVHALLALSEETHRAEVDPLQLLKHCIGGMGDERELLSPAQLPVYVTKDQVASFVAELGWPQAADAQAEFVSTLMEGHPLLHEEEMAPTERVSLVAIASAAYSHHEGMGLLFWLLDRQRAGIVTLDSIRDMLPDMAAVAAAALVAIDTAGPGLGDIRVTRFKIHETLAQVLAMAASKSGQEDITQYTVSGFVHLGDKFAQELMLLLAEDVRADPTLEEGLLASPADHRSVDENSSAPAQASRPGGGLFKRGKRLSWSTAAASREDAETSPTRRRRTSRSQPVFRLRRSMFDLHQQSVLEPDGNDVVGIERKLPRQPPSLGDLPPSPVNASVTPRPSIIAAQRAAEQAAQAAASEGQLEAGTSKAGWSGAIASTVTGFALLLVTRLCMADAARMLMLVTIMLVDGCIVAAFVLQLGMPVIGAMGVMVAINLVAAGLALMFAIKGCCCGGRKKEPEAPRPSILETEVRPAVQRYIQDIHRTITQSDTANQLRDVDDFGSFDGRRSTSLDLSSTATPQQQPSLLGRAQSIWQVIGHVAGFQSGQTPPGRQPLQTVPESSTQLSMFPSCDSSVQSMEVEHPSSRPATQTVDGTGVQSALPRIPEP